MQHNSSDILSWNETAISKALKIGKEDVKEYFTDGRRISFLLERRLAKEILHGKLANNEGEDFDVLDSKGNKWEVRSISKDGIYFCPSYMIGSGRHFNKRGFFNKLKNIKGYVVSDITLFPNIPFWIITKNEVMNWWDNKELGKTTKITRKKALTLISRLTNKTIA